jgi:hypothetical protein
MLRTVRSLLSIKRSALEIFFDQFDSASHSHVVDEAAVARRISPIGDVAARPVGGSGWSVEHEGYRKWHSKNRQLWSPPAPRV